MWKQISVKNAVWYVDATSNIHQNINGQNKVYMYSIVCHDKEKKTFVNVADFFTTCHTSTNLTKYFFDIFSICEKSNSFLAPIVVTDFSWPLIISILRSSNNCDVLHYLHWCYDLVVNKIDSPYLLKHLKTRLILCSVHFFKNALKKTNKMITEYKREKISAEIRKIFLFSFSLLINSISLNEFENYLLNIFNVFSNLKKTESVMYSLRALKDDLRSKNLNSTVIDLAETKEECNAYFNIFKCFTSKFTI